MTSPAASRSTVESTFPSDLTIPRPNSDTLEQVLAKAERQWVSRYLALSRMRPPGAFGELHGAVMALAKKLSSSSPQRLISLIREPTQLALIGAILRHARPGGHRAKVAGWLVELHLNSLLHFASNSASRATSSPEAGSAPSSWEIPVRREAAPRGWPVMRSLVANVEVRIPEDVREIRFRPGLLCVIDDAGKETVVPLETGDSVNRDVDSGAVAGVDPDPGDGEGRQGTPDGGGHQRPHWIRAPYHHIADGIYLATTDNNPLVNVQNHPEREGNPLDLAGRTPEEWVESLGTAYRLIADHLPDIAREMRQLLRIIVPVGWDPERHSSASYEEAVGAIYLTLHPSPMTLAEALIHEFQHNKLYSVLAFDRLLVDGENASYSSPLRPDPRPLRGVLFAVHAFQPVAKLYESMTLAEHPLSKGRDWERRMRDILRINRDGAKVVIENARPTALGRSLLNEMQAIEQYFEGRYEASPSP